VEPASVNRRHKVHCESVDGKACIMGADYYHGQIHRGYHWPSKTVYVTQFVGGAGFLDRHHKVRSESISVG
jgi:hypothetical protein